MFRILIKQTSNCAKQSTRNYARSRRYISNPGIRRQVKAETNEIEYDTHWDDDISKFEGNLTNTRAIYEQYRQETVEHREQLKRHIVRDKYFSEKKPTFLTWGEMEQIRLFNAKDPEEWNKHKLAESFPADVVTIQKILKAKWQPSDSKRVARHDEKVRSNWESFANGDFKEMDPRFSEHLKKFSRRNLNTKVNYDSMLKKEMPKPESTEFVGIISSCKKYEVEPKQISSKSPPPKLSEKEYVTTGIGSRKLYTFKPTSSDESGFVSSGKETIFNNPFGTGVKPQTDSNIEDSTLSVTRYENNEVQLHESDLKRLSMPSIRDHIVIPPKLYKEGATYRLGDCYYDDDGEFLYSVPGMTKS
ncbi:hypothetical protein HA402_012502 [Bradysia odoriphaga]|nr:hypothetical protein HA402_012502 [Bradysia odoriphaga]